MNILCSRCKKRMAVVFVTRMEGDESVNEGLCIQCAKELGIKPVSDLVDKMGLSDDELESMNSQLMDIVQQEGEDGFEMGGAQPFPFLQNIFGSPAPNQNQQGKENNRRPEKKEKPKEKKLKYLNTYCENLTRRAQEGKIDRIVGRDEEIYRVMQILNRRTKNNPCLIGEPGVGKTAIAEGIALRLASGNVPYRLENKQLYLLDLTALVAGTQFRGQFESRVKGLVNEIKEVGNVILFIDEVHNLVGAGDSEGSMNAANILKPALSRGEIQVIGATTFNEYRKHIEKDAALERRFQPVKIGEPNIEDTVQILQGIKGYYEKHHRVTVPDGMVRQIAVLSERYIVDRFLPDKAIDLLDEACSCAVLGNQKLAAYDQETARLRELREELSEMEQETGEIDYEKIAELKAEISRTTGQLAEMEKTAVNQPITLENVAKVIELWTGIPASKIQQNELRRVAGLAETLKKKIIGQDEAVELVAGAVRRARAQISGRRRPASFIFVGPTGVGKTELVKVLAHELFDDQEPLVHLDMTEFMEKYTVSRLIGSPPGYVGYDEAGQLTEKVRRRPYCVVLFDEIEKAHPDVMNILLQILDEGKITDAQGRVVNFENTVIVMTSNAGSERREGALGFNKTEGQASREKAEKALREFLRPEFLGRVDEVVVFRPLSEEDYRKIAALMLDELVEPLGEKGIRFGYDDAACAYIAHKAFGHESGARDIRRVIRREVEDQLSTLVIDTMENPPAGVQLTAAQDQLQLLTL